jgi:hypothetical protein
MVALLPELDFAGISATSAGCATLAARFLYFQGVAMRAEQLLQKVSFNPN